MKQATVTLADIEQARQFLKTLIEPTPLLYNQWLSQILGFECYLKLENMLPIGSFKMRGAAYKISTLTPAEKKKGVICASAGNHAQGVAWAARHLHVDATIVMPEGASLVKVQNTRALGAKVVLQGATYDEAFAHASTIARRTGKVFVHAFEDSAVIAGQGTIGLEIMDQLPEVDAVIGSLGGGGLMAGTGTALKALKPKVKVYGCQAVGAPSIYKSFKTKRAVTLDHVDTFADGIAVRSAKPAMLKILKNVLDDIWLADDEAIASSMLMLMEKAKVVAEASAAISLSVAEQMKHKLKGKKVVIIICGGNVDVNVLGRVIDRGLIKAGRRIRLNVHISDRPGSLSALTGVIAAAGANVVQAIHDRGELSTGLNETGVELTLETRGPEHTKELLKKLRGAVTKLDMLH
jgi:threonine dehydratase